MLIKKQFITVIPMSNMYTIKPVLSKYAPLLRKCKLRTYKMKFPLFIYLISSEPDGKNPYSSRRRLRPEMISGPQGDFKHTGHVGLDGAYFGDVSFLGDKVQDGRFVQKKLDKVIVCFVFV